MQLQPNTPLQALDKIHKKEQPRKDLFDRFTSQLRRLGERIETAQGQSEEHLKGLLKEFLQQTFYDGYSINPASYRGLHEADLVMRASDTDPVQVLIEVKRPGSNEMISSEKPARKAILEAITYYLWEREVQQNREIKHVVVTDLWNWFVFDGQEFFRKLGDKKPLLRFFHNWKDHLTDNDRTSQMYSYLESFLNDEEISLDCTFLDIRSLVRDVESESEAAKKRLIASFKFLSPDHLLKGRKKNDSNALNKEFYYELLHILGLEETKDKGKKIIQRAASPHPASLIENAITKVRTEGRLQRVQSLNRYGEDEASQLFGVGLELAITWINRVLFLKLLEAQLITYHGGDRSYAFLDPTVIREFDDLNALFFEVLAAKPADRSAEVKDRFAHIPYLNSSLFETSELEMDTISISGLRDSLELPVYTKTVLKDQQSKSRKGEAIPTLTYLLEFLNAYDFGAESKDGLIDGGKTLINASVLGLIFEKINGYQDGAFFTPGFITMYMARETLSRAVIEKFTAALPENAMPFQSLSDIYNAIGRKISLVQANEIVNSLTICDPAVGSGHFLVSCLNELIAIKSELGILMDEKGKLLRDWSVKVEDDELVIEDSSGEAFRYIAPTPGSSSKSELQRVQETLFLEKRHFIERSLFGVDINPNSVKICRLRLWIELLKHTFYREDSGYRELETLPNLDINIKTGNSLVSRFALEVSIADVLKKQKRSVKDYLTLVQEYRVATDPSQKRALRTLIAQLKESFMGGLSAQDNDYKRLTRLQGEYFMLFDAPTLGFKESVSKDEAERKKKGEKLLAQIEALKAKVEDKKSGTRYRGGFEWRFEFPEVMAENGDFIGFDVVIANPPYIRQEELKEFKDLFKERFQTFAGTADLYVYFVELGIDLLKPDGHFCYIFPNKWMRAGYGRALRNWTQQYQIDTLIDFGDLPVFEEATTYPIVLNMRKQAANDSMTVAEVENLDFDGLSLSDYLTPRWYDVRLAGLQEEGWSLVRPEVQALLDKLRATGVPLGEYVNGKIYYGIKTGLNEAFVIDGETRERLIAEDPRSAEVIKPFLAGRDVKRFRVNFRETYLIFTRRGIDIESYPAILSYLEQFREGLEPKPAEWKPTSTEKKWPGRKTGSYKWYEIQDAVDYYPAFEEPKILYQEIATYSSFSFEEEGFYANNKVFLIPGARLGLLGLLNSKLIWFFLNQIASKLNGGALAMQSPTVMAVPIEPEVVSHPRIEALVTEILSLKADDPDTDTTVHEAEIDQLVYGLYGLGEEEVRLVEGG